MKKIYLIIATILFSLNSFAQSYNIDFYINLKKMNFGQIEEALTLEGWNFEGINKSGDFVEMLSQRDMNMKSIRFSYYNQNSEEVETKLYSYLFSSSEKDNLVKISTTDFYFFQNLLKNIIRNGYSIKKSYEDEYVVDNEYNKYGDELLIKPFVKIYSNGSFNIKITTSELVKFIEYKDEVFTYNKIKNSYYIEF